MGLIFRRTVFDHNVLALDEACFLQALAERHHEVRGVGERGVPQETNNRHRRLLRARRERPRGYAAEERYERASPHSITPSARTKNVSEIARPSVLAVLRFTISSNFVGCSIGRSAGLAPLRMRSTKYAARRYRPRMFTP